MKKLLKVLLCTVCTLLVFALAISPVAYTLKASFEEGTASNITMSYTPPSPALGVEVDGDSLPLKAPELVLDAESSFAPEADVLDTAIKNLLSINALINSIKVPAPVEPPKHDNTVSTAPDKNNSTSDKDNGKEDNKTEPGNKVDFDDVVLTDEYALLKQPDGSDFIYYEQTWDAYTSYPYGSNTVGGYGCGPTSMAMVISNITGNRVSPTYMADWSVEHGYYVRGRGTAYGLFPAASNAFGIDCDTIAKGDHAAIKAALREGKYLITVVRSGDFTNGRHFLLIRGITEDGKLLMGDSGKYENSLEGWDYDRVMRQVALDKFWVFSD